MAWLVLFLSWIPLGFAALYETAIRAEDRGKTEITWEVTETAPFDELILSWNALRSNEGRYAFFVSLRQKGEWSPFLYYGDWGSRGQMLCAEAPPESLAVTDRGFTRPKMGTCDGFRVHVLAPGEEKLSGMETLWVNLNHLAQFRPEITLQPLEQAQLEHVPGQSVHSLRLNRHYDMTMVASMLSAIRYLGNPGLSAADLATYVCDNDFESYDFWPLHAAESYHRLGGKYRVHIERLSGFAALHSHLMKGLPVVVNILGSPLGGMAWPPYRCHTLCVVGYDPTTRTVLCLDPVFPNDKATFVHYPLDDFLRVWAKRQNIACLFEK